MLCRKNAKHTIWLGILQKETTPVFKDSMGLGRLNCPPVFISEVEAREVVKVQVLQLDLRSPDPSSTIS